MRTPNVLINIRERGKLVDRREGHNIWVDYGRNYLAGMVGYSSFDPDVPEAANRVRYLGVGIGGFEQSAVIPPVVDTAYPVGFDPLTTTGNEYREDFPFIVNPSPPPSHNAISTLERPVRIVGSSNPYGTALPTDRWLVTETNGRFFTTHATLTELTVHAIIDATVNEVVYAPFPSVPLSEAGLFLSGSSTTGRPFQSLVSYITFDTISLDNTIDIEFIWSVKF